MQKGVILSVDDDADLQTVLGNYLEDDGYKVVTAGNVAMALEKAVSLNVDVILLDLILPDGEGMSIIPQLRSKTQAAIIVVSGKSDTMEKIVCLEMGADDYMTKPFELRELSARIKAVLRRSNDNSNDSFSNKSSLAASKAEKILFNGWCLDRTQYQLFDDKRKSADLTTGEFKLLEALVLSANRALSREHLFDLTRDQEYDSYDRAIDIQIARLRKKLKKDSKLIKTIRSVGYMFSGETQDS
jgi:two-component system OmpR family response regulator